MCLVVVVFELGAFPIESMKGVWSHFHHYLGCFLACVGRAKGVLSATEAEWSAMSRKDWGVPTPTVTLERREAAPGLPTPAGTLV